MAGAFFGLPQFLWSNLVGPALVDSVCAGSSNLAIDVLLKFRELRSVWRFERGERPRRGAAHPLGPNTGVTCSPQGTILESDDSPSYDLTSAQGACALVPGTVFTPG